MTRAFTSLVSFNLRRGFNVCIFKLVFSAPIWSGCGYFEALSHGCLDAKSGYWPRSKVPSQVPTVTAHWALFSLVERTEAGLWLAGPPSVQLMQLHTQAQAAQAKIYCAPSRMMLFRLSQARNLKPTMHFKFVKDNIRILDTYYLLWLWGPINQFTLLFYKL